MRFHKWNDWSSHLPGIKWCHRPRRQRRQRRRRHSWIPGTGPARPTWSFPVDPVGRGKSLDLWIFRDHLHISPSHFSEIFDIPCNSSGITCGKKKYIYPMADTSGRKLPGENLKHKILRAWIVWWPQNRKRRCLLPQWYRDVFLRKKWCIFCEMMVKCASICCFIRHFGFYEFLCPRSSSILMPFVLLADRHAQWSQWSGQILLHLNLPQ